MRIHTRCDTNDITIPTSNTIADVKTEKQKSSKRKFDSVTNKLLLAVANIAPAIEVNISGNNIEEVNIEHEVQCTVIEDKGMGGIVTINLVDNENVTNNELFVDTLQGQHNDSLINEYNDLIQNTNNVSCIETIENDSHHRDHQDVSIIYKSGERQIYDVPLCR